MVRDPAGEGRDVGELSFSPEGGEGEQRSRRVVDLWHYPTSETLTQPSPRGKGLGAPSPIVEADADPFALGATRGHFVPQPALPQEDAADLGRRIDEAARILRGVVAAQRGGHHH